MVLPRNLPGLANFFSPAAVATGPVIAA